MKWTAFTLDLRKLRKFMLNTGAIGKAFATLSLCTLLFFLLLGLASYAQARMNSSPVSSMKGLAASVASDFFLDMIGLEVPHLSQEKNNSVFSRQNVLGFVFRLLTDINPKDPKTLLALEVPGLGSDNATLLRKGQGTDLSSSPEDHTPPKGDTSGNKPTPQHDNSSAVATPPPTPSPVPTVEPNPAHLTTNGKKVVMFYHSHNRESWVPELGIKNPDDAYDAKINITLVGKRMSQKLEELGIGSVDYNPDYTSIEKGYNFAYSYKYSLKTVKEAFAANPDIKFVFDIHRDSLRRERTTVTIDGKDYAQVYFIIGQKNPNWEKNEQFATQVHEKLEKKMPGISRGIWGKSPHDGNAEYNQSLSPNNILIEVGGPFNTLEESYRTADLLSSVIADIYWNAEKVSAPIAAVKK